MFDVIVVCGPTASGKSDLAIEIADKFNGEVVSADSMQIYKEMNIGTAKPSADEMRGIDHHLLSFLPVAQEYSVSLFVDDASRCIDDIMSRGKTPVIAGGTGLYIDSLINNIDFQRTEDCNELREQLKKDYEMFGAEYLHNKLRTVDPEAASCIHKNNIKRVLRALEINILTGKTVAQVNAESIRARKYNTLFIGVNYRDRALLYDRINTRVDTMIENGLLDEAKELSRMNLSKTAVGAIGYKELFEYFDGNVSFEQAVDTLKQKTRNYAKRQITWFKRNSEIHWFYPDDYSDRSIFINEILNFIKNSEVKIEI